MWREGSRGLGFPRPSLCYTIIEKHHIFETMANQLKLKSSLYFSQRFPHSFVISCGTHCALCISNVSLSTYYNVSLLSAFIFLKSAFCYVELRLSLNLMWVGSVRPSRVHTEWTTFPMTPGVFADRTAALISSVFFCFDLQLGCCCCCSLAVVMRTQPSTGK